MLNHTLCFVFRVIKHEPVKKIGGSEEKTGSIKVITLGTPIARSVSVLSYDNQG